jgi:YVTN family beta-propeller protein
VSVGSDCSLEARPSLYIYVADSGSNSVSAINGESSKIVQNITVGEGPASVVVDPNNGYLYVSNAESGTLSVITFPSPSPPSECIL